ncbi:MAG TPA: Cys-tRNA(Pro) deacylase [Candidatus Merdousia gallistercoris]|nr:Cys-tRNA(Pro) deacylase [Candidatus Merdousia gallistercoris]
MEHKTNALRMLDQKKIPHGVIDCGITEAVSGTEMAGIIGENPDCVFKTLVTVGKSGEHFVFMIPVDRELDLKKAAAAVGEKSVAMIKSKELLPTTGYVHGGCSPIGMKKSFRTTIDSSAKNFEKILFSAGRIGLQIKAPASVVEKFARVKYADLTVGSTADGH